MERVQAILRAMTVPLLLVIAIEIAMRTFDVQSDVLARPIDIITTLKEVIADGTILDATWQTLSASFAGLVLGGGLGLVVGIVFGLSRRTASLGGLTVELLKPVPSVALIPLSMLTFGFGARMEIAVVAFSCFFPVLILTQAAVSQVEQRLLEVSYVLNLSTLQRIVKIVLPAASPRIFVALRLATGVALVVAVTVEIAANPYGLGYGMMMAQQSIRPDLMLAFLLWIGVLGWLLNYVLLKAQNRAFANHMLGQQA